jgi:histidine triad (HIT) family protein
MEVPMPDGAETGCIFCRILAGQAPGYVVGQNAEAVAILDIQPYARGHCLVIPRRHVPWWHDLEPAEATGLFALARETAQRIMRVFEPEFVSMYARGRRIPHTHIFLVPTRKGEPFDRHFNALEGFQEASRAMAESQAPVALQETLERLQRDRT